MTNNIGCTPPSLLTQRLLHTKLETTRTNAMADHFFAELREKHDVDDAIFLIDGAVQLQKACRKHDRDFRYERHGNRNSVETAIREIKSRPTSLSNCVSNARAETADKWLRFFPSYGISLFDHESHNTHSQSSSVGTDFVVQPHPPRRSNSPTGTSAPQSGQTVRTSTSTS